MRACYIRLSDAVLVPLLRTDTREQIHSMRTRMRVSVVRLLFADVRCERTVCANRTAARIYEGFNYVRAKC